MPQLSEVWALMSCMGFYGAGVGTVMGLFTLSMIDVVGLPMFHQTFGVCCLLIALVFVILGPFVGEYCYNFPYKLLTS